VTDPKQLVTVAIDVATSGDQVLWTPPAGTRWMLYALKLTAQGAVDVFVKSGATNISGVQTWSFTAADQTQELPPSEMPWMVARTASDAFTINLSGNVAVDGFATLGAESGTGPTV
jgi:hypothetical protein